MSKDDPFSGLPDDLQDLLSDVEKTASVIEIKIEKRKYGKMWAVVSGVETDKAHLKEILKHIKNKLAVAGTIKDKNLEILFGKTDKTKMLTDILVEEGFERDSIHSSK